MNAKCWKTLNLGLILMSAAVLGSNSGVQAQLPKPNSAVTDNLVTADEIAIRQSIAGIEQAWNSHDMKAYGALLADDVQWVNVVGMHWRGHKAVMDAHTAFHETIFKNHTFNTDSIEIRFLGSEIAIAVVTTTNDRFTTPDGSLVPKRQNCQSYVLRKSAGTWKIVHCHNVSVDAQAAKSDPVNAAR